MHEWLRTFLGAAMAKRLFGLDAKSPKTPRAKSGRPAPRSSLFYAELARDYAAAVEARDRRPIETIAAHHSLRVSDARRYVHEARNVRHLLTATGRGQRGGVLTDQAKRILKGGHK
jgi:hypothetical protein